MADRVLTGAIAIIRSGGKVIGRMKGIRCQENFRRTPVKGLGTILPSEKTVTDWDGTLSCDFMEVSIQKSGIPGAIRRDMTNTGSQVFNGGISFEDQLVLDADGVQIDIYKKMADLIDQQTGHIIPKAVPAYIVTRLLIESDSFDISEGAISGRSQSFGYLDPVLEVK